MSLPVAWVADAKDDPGSIKAAIDALMERVEAKNALEESRSVLLKPNYVVAEKYTSGNVTHPAVLHALISWLKEHVPRATPVLGEGGFTRETQSAFRMNGLLEICKQEGIELVDLNKDEKVTVTIPGAMALKGNLQIARTAFDADAIISVPSLKTHSLAGTTLSMKNFMGTLSKKSIMHSRIHEKIPELFSYFRAKAPFAIIDGVIGSNGYECGGDPVDHGLLLASSDLVALDAVGTRLMGVDMDECAYLDVATRLGLGNGEAVVLDLLGNKVDLPRLTISY